MGYQITRPDTDQLRFNSSSNGPVVLDDYLEAAELGGRALSALLLDLFNSSGVLRTLATPAEVASAIAAAADAAASQIAAYASEQAAAASAASIAGGPVSSVNGVTGVVTTKTINSAAITGTGDIVLPTLGSNTFTGAQAYSDQVLSGGMVKDMGEVFLDKGNSGTSAQTLDYTAGSNQKLTVTGAFTLNAVSNWPPSGNLGALTLELVNGASSVVTWPTINWVKSDGSFTTTFASNGVTLQASGTDFVLLWSRDAGTTVYGKIVR